MEEELRLLKSSTSPGKNIPGPVDDQRSVLFLVAMTKKLL